ncbi:MAG TPA: cohesin domain-containing protein, partial [Candidatus Nitrosotalea sp.]|nr:cohesin domain-containing protein [Candidatus Nitrosotalea sp.]
EPTGNQIAFGSLAQSGTARILARRVIGDNNATDTLDVGDSAIILRLLTGLDPVRAWDITGNDVNASGNLDSGDVIRVLRAVVGLDPQPPIGGSGGSGAKVQPRLHRARLSGSASLSLDKTRAQPGELVTLQVRLDGITTPVSGASLTVEYPTNALRLVNPLSYRPGAMVPGTAVALWNMAPAQTNFAAQTGRISFGASSGLSWPTNNGVVVELVFQAQSTQTAQYLWPIRLTGTAVASDGGFDLSSLLDTSVNYIGRDQLPSVFDTASVAYTPNGLSITLGGEAGLSYLIEKSTDLVNWSPLTVINNPNGTATFLDTDALNNPKRFYRAKSQ